MKHVRFNRHLYRRAAERVFRNHDDFPLWVPPLKPTVGLVGHHDVGKE
jgi:hypothetical protein